MQIVCNQKEEDAIKVYAKKHNISFGEAFQKMMDAMTKGLMELVNEDGEIEQISKTTTKVEIGSQDLANS